MPKKSAVKNFLAVTKRFFRARNIIVVSAHKVEHIPLSGIMQVIMVIMIIGGVSVFSYLAGGYAAARAKVVEKERRLHASEVEKNLMGKDFALLKQDLMKIRSNGKELSDYSKFILEQYSSKRPQSVKPGVAKVSTPGDDKLVDRIGYLEKRVNEITTENTQLIYAIRERTQGKIDLFEDIISTTGLNMDKLESAVETPQPAKPTRVSGSPPAKALDVSGQGGPFIPYDPTAFNKDNQALLGDIERLVQLNRIVSTLPIGLPMASYQERSGFGTRTDPFNHGLAFHPGLDLAGPLGSKIIAANDGVVRAAGLDGSYGNMVDINHGLGISTRYAHMSKVLVREGDRVRKGQAIGIEGSTGRSTGPHLHYEVRYHGHAVDPKKFLNARALYVSQE